MTVGHLFEDIHAKPLPEFHHALLMAGWAEMAALAREGQQIFMAAVFAFHTSETVLQIAAIQIPKYNIRDIRPPKSILP